MLTTRHAHARALRAPTPRGEQSVPDIWIGDSAERADEQFVGTLLSAAFRRKGLIFAIFLALSVLSAVVIAILPVSFLSEVLVSIEQRQARVINVESVISSLTPDVETFQTEIHVILSRPILRKVVEAIDLSKFDEYALGRKPGGLDVIAFRAKQALQFFGVARDDSDIDPTIENPSPEQATEYAVERLQSRLQVSQLGKSRILRIAISSGNPKLASDIVNAVSDAYIGTQLQSKIDATKRANEWIGERVADLQKQVAQSDTAVETYREQAGLTKVRSVRDGIVGEGDGTLLSEQLAEVSRQYVATQNQKALIGVRLQNVETILSSGGDLSNTSDILQSTLIQALRQREVELSGRIQELSGRYGAQYPAIINAQRELNEVHKQISGEISKIANSLRNDYRVQAATEVRLKAQVDELSRNAKVQNADEIHLRALERVADTNRNLLQTFLTRWKETSSDQNLPQPDAAIVAVSLPSLKPSFPNYRLFGAASLLLSLLAGVGTALIVEKLNHGLLSMQQVEQAMGVRALGLVPQVNKRRFPIDLRQEPNIRASAAYAESIKALCVKLRLTSKSAPCQALLVTSAMPGEAKSTLVCSMAKHLASYGKRVAIVDGDLRRPSLHRLLKTPAGPGLRQWLTEGGIVTVHASATPGVSLIPAGSGASVKGDVGIFDSEAVGNLVEDLKRQFDVVIIDSPPVLAVADTLTLSEVADQIVIAVRWSTTPLAVAMRGMHQIYESSNKVAGVVLTLVNEKRQAQYGFGDSGFFHKDVQRYYST